MDLYSEAIKKFSEWWDKAQTCGLKEPTAVTLATADKSGRPSSRTVLLKGFDDRGFVFYTNFESRKGRQLAENPHAALTFYWPPLERQVQVEGPATAVSPDEADAYWKTRPRESRIGAWASEQSRPLEGRFELEKRVAKWALKYAVGDIPRPAYWSGWRIAPERIEFWTARPFRLHERVLYTNEGGTWAKKTLFP